MQVERITREEKRWLLIQKKKVITYKKYEISLFIHENWLLKKSNFNYALVQLTC